MWTAWPLRMTRAEVEEMGVNIEKGEQVDVEDVLGRWDPDTPVNGGESSNGLESRTSKFRDKLDSHLLGVSSTALKDSLPHLDVGDAVAVCNEGSEPMDESTAEGSRRKAMTDVLSGRRVLVSRKRKPVQDSDNDATEPEYGPWSTRYCGHQFGVWAGQLGDGRAISLLETESEGGGRQEIQLKGAGRTPFSRQADGLAVMRSGVREYLGCEGESGQMKRHEINPSGHSYRCTWNTYDSISGFIDHPEPPRHEGGRTGATLTSRTTSTYFHPHWPFRSSEPWIGRTKLSPNLPWRRVAERERRQW